MKLNKTISMVIAALIAFHIFQSNGCNSHPVPQNRLSVYFSSQTESPERILTNLFNTVQKGGYIYVAIYAFDSEAIFQSLKEAKNRGVDVKIIADSSQTKNSQKDILDKLKAIGVPIKVNIDPYKNMHMKVSIINDRYVATGSCNYTQKAQKDNEENLLVIPAGADKKAVMCYRNAFLDMWENMEKYRDY